MGTCLDVETLRVKEAIIPVLGAHAVMRLGAVCVDGCRTEWDCWGLLQQPWGDAPGTERRGSWAQEEAPQGV